ncbi:MAG TPA: hypothetical protein VKV24_00240 [Casimicrobiaceae bacterium]|nr:hypothetical protein [Casimicrobiaceae bacterium]
MIQRRRPGSFLGRLDGIALETSASVNLKKRRMSYAEVVRLFPAVPRTADGYSMGVGRQLRVARTSAGPVAIDNQYASKTDGTAVSQVASPSSTALRGREI